MSMCRQLAFEILSSFTTCPLSVSSLLSENKSLRNSVEKFSEKVSFIKVNEKCERSELLLFWHVFCTLFEIFINVQKFNFDYPREIVELFWMKTREKTAILDFLAVDNFDFPRKL